MMPYQEWMKYAKHDEKGLCGIEDSAPQWAKDEYRNYLEITNNTLSKDGIRLEL